MRPSSFIASGTRHVLGVGLQALLITAILGLAALSASAVYKPAGLIAGLGNVDAAKPASGAITVAEPVSHGGTTTATVNPGGADVYVFVRCYTPDLDGAYVYAAYFPVGADQTAVIGPLASSKWTRGAASCIAEEGYFTRNGFGRWVIEASDRFNVNP